MPLIHIDHRHGLSLPAALSVAQDWARAVQSDWAMTVQSELYPLGGDGAMVWQFTRSGADGTLQVTPDKFVLNLRLGFLLGTFKDRIEAQLRHTLRERLAL